MKFSRTVSLSRVFLATSLMASGVVSKYTIVLFPVKGSGTDFENATSVGDKYDMYVGYDEREGSPKTTNIECKEDITNTTTSCSGEFAFSLTERINIQFKASPGKQFLINVANEELFTFKAKADNCDYPFGTKTGTITSRGCSPPGVNCSSALKSLEPSVSWGKLENSSSCEITASVKVKGNAFAGLVRLSQYDFTGIFPDPFEKLKGNITKFKYSPSDGDSVINGKVKEIDPPTPAPTPAPTPSTSDAHVGKSLIMSTTALGMFTALLGFMIM